MSRGIVGCSGSALNRAVLGFALIIVCIGCENRGTENREVILLPEIVPSSQPAADNELFYQNEVTETPLEGTCPEEVDTVKPTGKVEVGVNLDAISNIKGFNVFSGENDVIRLTVGYPSSVFEMVHSMVTPGSYTGNELAKALETALEMAAGTTGLIQDYSVTYDGDTGRFAVTLVSSDSSGYQFSVAPGSSNRIHFSAGIASGDIELNPDGRTRWFNPPELASHLESRLEFVVGGEWTASFDGQSGKYGISMEKAPLGTDSVTLLWTAPETTAESMFGFARDAVFTEGGSQVGDVSSYDSVEFGTYLTAIEQGLNSGLVVRSRSARGVESTGRAEIAPGIYFPNELAEQLQRAIRSSGLDGAGQIQVLYDQGSGDFIFRNSTASGATMVLDWDARGPTNSDYLTTDEGLPVLFGFNRHSKDLDLSPGSVARSSSEGSLVPGRAFEFSRLIGFTSDPNGGPAPHRLTEGATKSGTSDIVHVGQTRVSDAVAGRFDPRNAANTANFSISAVVLDSLEYSRVVELHFRMDAKEMVSAITLWGETQLQVRRWEWFAAVSQNDAAPFTVTESNRRFLFAIEGEDVDEEFADSDSFRAVTLGLGAYDGEELAEHLASILRENGTEFEVKYDRLLGRFRMRNGSTTQPVAIDFDGDQVSPEGAKTSPGFAGLLGFDRKDSSKLVTTHAGTATILPASAEQWASNAQSGITSEFPVGVGLEIEAGGILRFRDNGLLLDVIPPEGPESLGGSFAGQSKYGFFGSLSLAYSNFDFRDGAEPDQVVFFDFGDPTVAGRRSPSDTTQFNAQSFVWGMLQDGYLPGVLVEVQDPPGPDVLCIYEVSEKVPRNPVIRNGKASNPQEAESGYRARKRE